jgi:hypothetical protein
MTVRAAAQLLDITMKQVPHLGRSQGRHLRGARPHHASVRSRHGLARARSSLPNPVQVRGMAAAALVAATSYRVCQGATADTTPGTIGSLGRVDESVDTPGSVPCRRYQRRGDGHPSRPAIADRFQRPTRRLGRAVLERLLSGLAPGGVYRAAPVTWGAGGLLHRRFTLTPRPAEAGLEAVCSLWHCPADHSGWLLATTLPCGARTFLGRTPEGA